MKRFVLRFNNWLVRRRRHRFRADEVLLLGPRCLQNHECRRDIVADAADCLGCGRCDIFDLRELSRRWGVRLAFVTGGGLALELVRRQNNRAIVALACEKELFWGLFGKRRKPVLVIPIERPQGPCRDTRVAVCEVERCLRIFIRSLENHPDTGPARLRGGESKRHLSRPAGAGEKNPC